MLSRILSPLWKAAAAIPAIQRDLASLGRHVSAMRSALGRIEERQCAARSGMALGEHEFQVFSQWGEDGILAHLLRHVPVPRNIFVEFGVEDYTEANTRYLLEQHHWSGLVLDGSERNVRRIRQDPVYWRHNLKAVQAFVTRENIDSLLIANGVSGPIGLLSIDIDGVDYWVWEAIEAVQPTIVVAEYNSLFGATRAVTVPYDPAFVRIAADRSNVYYGASLGALNALAERRGMALVGTNRAGNNAFFVRRDALPPALPALTVEEAFRPRCFREARGADGELLFMDHAEEENMIRSLPLVEVDS